MGHTYTSLLTHIIFSTKNRLPYIDRVIEAIRNRLRRTILVEMIFRAPKGAHRFRKTKVHGRRPWLRSVAAPRLREHSVDDETTAAFIKPSYKACLSATRRRH